jgi:5-methylcytosine-specific restriction enzyme B
MTFVRKNEKRYWIYAPGRNSIKWDEFYTQGIMGIGNTLAERLLL